MVRFSPVDPSEGREAYLWHRGYAASDDHLFPRPWPAYERMASEGQVWCAKDEKGDYLALAYSMLEHGVWEFGGLMVSVQEKGKGIGSTMARLTLGHLLFEEDPISRGERIIAHIHADNKEPRPIIEKVLKFAITNRVRIHGSKLPGLKTNADGYVEGDEYALVTPDTLTDLAQWCRGWKGKRKDGRPAEVVLREGISLQTWAAAFESMAQAIRARA